MYCSEKKNQKTFTFSKDVITKTHACIYLWKCQYNDFHTLTTGVPSKYYNTESILITSSSNEDRLFTISTTTTTAPFTSSVTAPSNTS